MTNVLALEPRTETTPQVADGERWHRAFTVVALAAGAIDETPDDRRPTADMPDLLSASKTVLELLGLLDTPTGDTP